MPSNAPPPPRALLQILQSLGLQPEGDVADLQIMVAEVEQVGGGGAGSWGTVGWGWCGGLGAAAGGWAGDWELGAGGG